MTIADEEWLRRFQQNEVAAPPGSTLDVEMTLNELELDEQGNPLKEPEYTITKVYGVTLPPANQQTTLFSSPP
jgi:hypothetical protein